MVRAILAGTKTQTRRAVKPQPQSVDEMTRTTVPYNGSGEFLAASLRCPYGKPGDRLWVRETWVVANEHPDMRGRAERGDKIAYRARMDGFGAAFDAGNVLVRWRSPIHMPRWASRITLEVTKVRVERLQDISEEDARAEGVVLRYDASKYHGGAHRTEFAILWRQIHGEGAWAWNPWVWVVEFRRITP